MIVIYFAYICQLCFSFSFAALVIDIYMCFMKHFYAYICMLCAVIMKMYAKNNVLHTYM